MTGKKTFDPWKWNEDITGDKKRWEMEGWIYTGSAISESDRNIPMFPGAILKFKSQGRPQTPPSNIQVTSLVIGHGTLYCEGTWGWYLAQIENSKYQKLLKEAEERASRPPSGPNYATSTLKKRQDMKRKVMKKNHCCPGKFI